MQHPSTGEQSEEGSGHNMKHDLQTQKYAASKFVPTALCFTLLKALTTTYFKSKKHATASMGSHFTMDTEQLDANMQNNC